MSVNDDYEPGEGNEDGPENDDWIHKAYLNQAGPNPARNAPAKPGWADTFNDRRTPKRFAGSSGSFLKIERHGE